MSREALVAGRSDRFATALAAIDDVNAGDPETLVLGGVEVPKEPTHARMMCEWVLRLDPDADELQLLAARGHHLRRWALPRTDFPEGRAGYLRWRTEQKRRHAAEVGEIMAAAGYDDADAERVGQIIRKQGLGSDPAVQVHEDALCLVFLATQFGPVTEELGDDKMVDVLAKTMRKMSPEGLAATAELGIDEHGLALVARAAAQVAGESA